MLRENLDRNRSEVLQSWARRIVDGYHPRTQKFLKGTANPFDNPVGQAVDDATRAIYGYLVDGSDEAALYTGIEQFIRIRAVQDFRCREAIGFVFLLKPVLRERFGRQLKQGNALDEWLQFESRIDDVALLCFEKFVEAREELFHIQNRSIQRETHKLVERMNRMSSRLEEVRGGDDDAPYEEENDNGRDS